VKRDGFEGQNLDPPNQEPRNSAAFGNEENNSAASISMQVGAEIASIHQR